MKKIALTLTTLLLSSSLYAVDVDRVSDMKKMANSMSLIMNGILYDNIDNLESGSDKIRKTAASIQKHDLKKYLPSNTAYAYKFAQKSLRRITEYANELDEAAKAKDFESAFESATLLMRQCNSCHSRVRGW